MNKNKRQQKRMESQNDFIFRQLESQNESIQYMFEALTENYSRNDMIMHMLIGKISVSK